MIFEKPLIKEAQTQVTKSPPKVIVWPSNQTGTSHAANFTYFVRQPAMPTPVNVIRPNVMGQNTSLITNSIKPIMATSIYDHGKKDDMSKLTFFRNHLKICYKHSYF